MGFVSAIQLLEEAKKNKFAVPAFNFHSLEMLQAIIAGAEECRSPVILQTTAGTVKHLGLEYIAAMAKVAASQVKVPVVLHLDHCQSIELIVQAIRAGYTSVMLDASQESWAENVRKSKQVADLARAVNVNVEAEIGRVGGVEDEILVEGKEAFLADPDECVGFVRQTGITSLAPAVGTAHGLYKGAADIDYDRIGQIAARVDVPLVLHGGSGIPGEQIRRCIALGMSKINFATELKHAFTEALAHYLTEHPAEKDPRFYMEYAKAKVRQLVQTKIELCGSTFFPH